MKKACLILMIITVIAVMGFSLIGCNNKEETNDNLCYDIKINLTENKLTGEQTVSYNNVYCENLTESVFHLYPNAYAENAKNKAYVIEPSVYGGIEVTSVKSGENNVEYTISECGEYLTVKHGEVKKNDNISLNIRLVGLEPTTPRLSSACSNQLSYSRVDVEEKDRDAHREPRLRGIRPECALCD